MLLLRSRRQWSVSTENTASRSDTFRSITYNSFGYSEIV